MAEEIATETCDDVSRTMLVQLQLHAKFCSRVVSQKWVRDGSVQIVNLGSGS